MQPQIDVHVPIVAPRIVLLTGPMGSGKSSAGMCFRHLGVPVIDADLVARAIHQDPQHPLMMQIAEALPQLVTGDGRLQRGILRAVLAHDAHVNRRLLDILKPHVLAAMLAWTAQQNAPSVIWETALLPDEDDGLMYDSALLVHADAEIRLQRVRQRNPDWTETDIIQVFNLQATADQYQEYADAMITNHGSIMELEQSVLQQHLIYMSHWSK